MRGCMRGRTSDFLRIENTIWKESLVDVWYVKGTSKKRGLVEVEGVQNEAYCGM